MRNLIRTRSKIRKSVLAVGLLSALPLMSCSDKSPHLVPVAKLKTEDKQEKPKGFISFNPKVDILFVIDNSGSMEPTQQMLALNIDKFAQGIANTSILDFHIGVLTTDMQECTKSCGRLIGNPSFVTKQTPDLIQTLVNNFLVGISGDAIEMMFAPVVAALSSPLESGVNKDFYRQDAMLAIFFITDAAEQSAISEADFLKFLVDKKMDEKKILAYGVLRKIAEFPPCPGSESLTNKLESFLDSVTNTDAFRGNVLSLCSTDYGTKLAEYAKDIVKRSASVVRLNRLPQRNSIVVKYGTQEIPNDPTRGWVYEPSTNSLILSETINWYAQPLGTELTVDFEVYEPM